MCVQCNKDLLPISPLDTRVLIIMEYELSIFLSRTNLWTDLSYSVSVYRVRDRGIAHRYYIILNPMPRKHMQADTLNKLHSDYSRVIFN